MASPARPGTVLAKWQGDAVSSQVYLARRSPRRKDSIVSDWSDAAVMATLHRQLTFAAAKQVVASSNLANVNTPGYKAKETSFSDSLARQLSGGPKLTTTNARHISGDGSDLSLSTTKNAEGPARRDGNTVQIDRELLYMPQAAGQFAHPQTAPAARFRLVRYPIGEGK